MKETIITPENNFLTRFDLIEIYRFRDLFSELFSKDLKMRYKQTAVGVLWAIIQPLLTTIVFTLFFGRLIKVSGYGLPYPVFVFIGLMFWNFFANSLTQASGSLIGNESLIKKVYFPRYIVPIAAVATNLFDLAITGVFFIILMAFYDIVPSVLTLVYFLVAVSIVLITSTGAGLFLSALNVKYRDVKHILPFFIQILIFVTPVIYPVSIFSETNRWIMALNPLSSSIDLVRYSFTGETVPIINLITSVVVAIVTFLVGTKYFSRTQKYFADVL